MKYKKGTMKIVFGTLAVFLFGFFIYYMPSIVSSKVEYSSQLEEILIEGDLKEKIDETKITKDIKEKPEIIIIPVSHIKTPEVVKAVYISSWVAGSESFRNSIIKLIDDTELNAIVIDIKDSTGRVAFNIPNENIIKLGSTERRISNIRYLTNLLHEKNIYIIGRISVFQDPYLSKIKPEWAITRKSDGQIWKDRKGLSFLDPTNKEVHNYILDVALGAYDEGFDEINFDYIRYPSDGNMKDINYHLKEGEKREDKIEDFFKFISYEMREKRNIPISADLFGLTTEAFDDMGIGQIWEKTVPYFDFVSPMVYPSHYPPGYMGYKNPSQYPYEVIYKSISAAIAKNKQIDEDINKIRPWLQDFDMGTTYTKELVQAQMKALYDLGLSSWMLWDPSNKYTPGALVLEKNI